MLWVCPPLLPILSPSRTLKPSSKSGLKARQLNRAIFSSSNLVCSQNLTFLTWVSAASKWNKMDLQRFAILVPWVYQNNRHLKWQSVVIVNVTGRKALFHDAVSWMYMKRWVIAGVLKPSVLFTALTQWLLRQRENLEPSLAPWHEGQLLPFASGAESCQEHLLPVIQHKSFSLILMWCLWHCHSQSGGLSLAPKHWHKEPSKVSSGIYRSPCNCLYSAWAWVLEHLVRYWNGQAGLLALCWNPMRGPGEELR